MFRNPYNNPNFATKWAGFLAYVPKLGGERPPAGPIFSINKTDLYEEQCAKNTLISRVFGFLAGKSATIPKTMSKFRGFVGTVFHLDEEGRDNGKRQKLDDLLNEERCVCGTYQVERSPTTGRLHLQFYLEFSNPRALRTIQRKLGSHVEARRGSARQAWDYCTKEESRVEEGRSKGTRPEPNQAGKRNDWEEIKELFEAGGSVDDVYLTNPGLYARNPVALQRLWERANKATDRDVQVLYIWGPSGTGKSWWVHEHYPNAYRLDMRPSSGEPWWDGYANEDVVVIEDFRSATIRFDTMLRILDRYPVRLPVKGASCSARYSTVILTSNEDPQVAYLNELDQTPFLRRLSKVIHLAQAHPGIPRPGSPTQNQTWQELEAATQNGPQPLRRVEEVLGGSELE